MSYISSEDRAFSNGIPRHEHRKTTRKMRWWYESLADFMISNPRATQGEIALHFGRAESTISTIIHTDAFKAYYRQRRDAHSERLDAGVRQKLLKVADAGLELILDKLDKKRDTIPIESLQQTVDSTLKNLGYGVDRPGPGVVLNVNNSQPQFVAVPVGVQDLEIAREALRRNQMRTLEPPATAIEDQSDEGGAPPQRDNSSGEESSE